MAQVDMNTQDDSSTESHTLRFALTPSVTAGHATTVIPTGKVVGPFFYTAADNTKFGCLKPRRVENRQNFATQQDAIFYTGHVG